jgi:hypothetical protein
MTWPMMRLSPVGNQVTITTRVTIVDIELYEILRPLQQKIGAAHQLFSNVVQAVQSMMIITWPFLER